MKIKPLKSGVCLVLITASLSLLAAVPPHGGPAGGPPGGGGPGWHGGGSGWHGGGNPFVWWGLGLGMGLAWPYYANPYPAYPYYYYPYSPPVVVAPPPPTVWYYCDPAQDYYPRVAQCPVPWRIVPATPAP